MDIPYKPSVCFSSPIWIFFLRQLMPFGGIFHISNPLLNNGRKCLINQLLVCLLFFDCDFKKIAFFLFFSLWPNYVLAHNNLATLLTDKGKAEWHLRRALNIDPWHSNSLYNLAVLLRWVVCHTPNHSFPIDKMYSAFCDSHSLSFPQYI